MTPEELCEIGLLVKAPDWPKGTRKATKEAFEIGKQVAAKAILDTIQNSGSIHMMFWQVRPKPFIPPKWTEEE